jgi:hypothetical protein
MNEKDRFFQTLKKACNPIITNTDQPTTLERVVEESSTSSLSSEKPQAQDEETTPLLHDDCTETKTH